jgi:hypothetical protein
MHTRSTRRDGGLVFDLRVRPFAGIGVGVGVAVLGYLFVVHFVTLIQFVINY